MTRPVRFTWLSLGVLAAATIAACAARETRFLPSFGTAPDVTFAPASGGLPESGMWKSDLAFADINGDGFVDFAATERLGKGPRVWLGTGTGSWTDGSAGLQIDRSCGGSVAFGDVNNDSRPDLVAADHCSGAYVYLQEPGVRWHLVTERLGPAHDGRPGGKLPERDEAGTMYPNGAESVAVGDIDQDRCLDLIIGSSDESGIRAFRGDCSGKRWTETPSGLPQTGFANKLRLADMNRDGHLDLVASYFEGPRVWIGDGQHHWRPASEGLPNPVFGGLYWAIAVGDVNSDGRPDLAVSNMVNGPEVYLQKSDGSWEPVTKGLPSMSAIGVALGDLDQDGRLDLIASGTSGDVGNVYGIFIARGDGSGQWSPAKSNLPTSGLPIVWGVGVADVDNDGRLDIAAASGGVPPLTETVAPALANRVVVWRANHRL